MPTKRELLEERTVKELKQMARDADLSGYSRARKDELIEIVNDGYTKAEIQSWSEEESVEEEPAEAEEEVSVEAEREKPQMEEPEMEAGWGTEEEPEKEETELEEELEELTGPEFEAEPNMADRKMIGGILLLAIIVVVLVLLFFLMP